MNHHTTRPMTNRVLLLISGTVMMGAAIGLLVRARLGLLPLDVLHSALALRTGWTIGGAIIATQALLLALYVPLRIKAGVGTVAGFVVPGVTADATLLALPEVTELSHRIALLIAGAAGFALGVALYLDAELGVLPRDGIIQALAQRRGHRLASLRVLTDLVCLVAGWFMLGPATAVHTGLVGVGSLALALAIGPSVDFLRAGNPLSPGLFRSRRDSWRSTESGSDDDPPSGTQT